MLLGSFEMTLKVRNQIGLSGLGRSFRPLGMWCLAGGLVLLIFVGEAAAMMGRELPILESGGEALSPVNPNSEIDIRTFEMRTQWAMSFCVSEEQLVAAVRATLPREEAVEEYFRSKKITFCSRKERAK